MKINTIKCKYYLATSFLLRCIRINEVIRKPATTSGVIGATSNITHFGSRGTLIGNFLFKGSTIKSNKTVHNTLNIVYQAIKFIATKDIQITLCCTL
mgnify:CR=1 FL=1